MMLTRQLVTVAALFVALLSPLKAADKKMKSVALSADIITNSHEIYELHGIEFKFDKNGEASFPFANASGKLLLKVKGDEILVDSNGDGKIDKTDTPFSDGKYESFASVNCLDQKRTFKYSLVLSKWTRGKFFLRGKTVLQGRVDGNKIILVDANMNGLFNEQLVDAIAIGKIKNQVPLSKIVNLDGSLMNVTFSTTTSALILSKYTGDTGVFDLKSGKKGWRTQGTFIKSDKSFVCIVGNNNKVVMPTGSYSVSDVIFSKGAVIKMDSKGWIYAAARLPITIDKGANELTIGSSLKLNFVAIKSKKDPSAIRIEYAKLTDSMVCHFDPLVEYRSSESTLRCFIQSGKKRKYLSQLEYD